MDVATTLKNRTLTITAFPTLHWDANGQLTKVTMSYKQDDSHPVMNGVVDPVTGDITLTKMPKNADYTDNVDITIKLDDSTALGPKKTHIPARFALPSEHNSDGTGPIWFCALPEPGTKRNPTQIRTPDGMAIGEKKTSSDVYLDDNQSLGGSPYAFCLAVVVPSVKHPPFTIEPIITGKGENDMPFMLKD